MSADHTAERALLRTVVTWARANGWRPRYRWQGDVTITWSRGPDIEIGVPGEYVGMHLPDPDNIEDIRHWLFDHHGRQIPVTSVREAVDVLAALGVLPAELSSQHAAGVRVGMHLAEELTDDAIEERAGLELDALLGRLDNDDTRRALGDWYDDVLVDPPILPDEPPYARRIRLEAIVEGASEILGADNAS